MEKRKKSTASRHDDHVSKETKRKKMKPITEKIRRERINSSLDELKLLILSALNEDVSHYAKMEKADILEMAVKYIKRLQNANQRPQGECSKPTEADTTSKIPTTTTITTTIHCNETKTLDMSLIEQPSPHSSLSTTGSLDLVLPAIPATFPDVAMETPAFSSSCRSFPSRDASSSVYGKEVTNFRFQKTYNDNKRSPFAMKEHNAMNTPSYKENASSIQSSGESNNHQTIRLPGMECFIRSNNYKTVVLSRDIDKENTASLDDFVHPFDNPQFALTLWRPW